MLQQKKELMMSNNFRPDDVYYQYTTVRAFHEDIGFQIRITWHVADVSPAVSGRLDDVELSACWTELWDAHCAL